MVYPRISDLRLHGASRSAECEAVLLGIHIPQILMLHATSSLLLCIYGPCGSSDLWVLVKAACVIGRGLQFFFWEAA